MSSITFVTGLWDIGRENLTNTANNYDWKRSFKIYTDRLEELLSTGLQIVVYGELEIKPLVDKYKNAIFVQYLKEIFYNLPYFETLQQIRTSKEWYDQPTAQWLKHSPQATLPLYVPITLNKIVLLEKSSQLNPFNSDRFYWLDAGITKTHRPELLINMHTRLLKYNKFLFLSHHYIDNTEIHGFKREGVHKYCNKSFVDRIMKGFFFGGKVDNLTNIMTLYNKIIIDTLDEKYLGTEETYFTILANQKPEWFDQIIIKGCYDTLQYL
jgi:hypothetical protein